MATKEEAIRKWRQTKSQFKINKGVRFAVTGDGNGGAASNFYHPTDKQYIWARDPSTPNKPFPVINRGRVRPAVDMPIIIGYDDAEPEFEQVLGVNYAALPGGQTSGSISQTIGQHHQQHEWGGGDEVFVDGRQIIPGLVYPTNPVSMQVRIKPFIYYHDGQWKRYDGGISKDFTEDVPSENSAIAILVVFNKDADEIQYISGNETSKGDAIFSDISSWLSLVPDPRPIDLPLGAVLLEDITTSIGWDENLIDTRRIVDTHDQATAVGQIRISLDGTTFDSKLPVTEKQVGLLFDSQSGLVLVS